MAETLGYDILLVDDDGEIRRLVSKLLREDGHRVTSVGSAVEMREAIARCTPDLVLLDVMLPGTDGLTLCRELRASSSLPIIMLTAKGDDVDRIVGLEMGADDYLAKPFHPRELLARIRAVLRRARPSEGGGAKTGREIRFAGWCLDTARRELTDPRGVVIDLSTGEYDLLLTFLETPHRVLSRELLLDATRNRDAEPFDRAIDVQVSRLRRKLETAGEVIKTVRGAGYLFVPDVERT
ncbi:response regulator [Pinisolibacter aquiterrae]|uniref:response regulator n=1 Tax=Pinisolibacter aquiterrae TaxID=2815579 RepID=UPI001E3F6FB3|nr:response regulator [Pinisolibacter aquiterrae]